MKICLVGNPNSGKTTLFNALTGLNQKVGNYSGVTVDKYLGHIKLNGQTADLIDLPGTYSLYPNSVDETIVLNTLTNPESDIHPDLVVVVVNATQVRRSLVLVTQIIDLGLPCIVAVNMIDEATRNNVIIDEELLKQEFGVPVCLMSATKAIGVKQLISEMEQPAISRHKPIIASSHYDKELSKVEEITGLNQPYLNFINFVLADKSRALSAAKRMQLLELQGKTHFSPTKAMAKDINARFSYANKLVNKMQKSSQNLVSTLTNTEKIDSVLTHNFWGLPIAFVTLFFVFQAIFSFASFPMDWLEGGFAELSGWITGQLPKSWFRDLLVNGILAGLSGVLVFIPQIAILFGLLAILEGTGYMARISFMLDQLMSKFGLSGRSVVPMMSGFACAIPAIMATRNVSNTKERLISILVIPLLSCSARLPVYVLLIGMFIPAKPILGVFNMQGLTMMGFYLSGLVLALLIAGLLTKILNIEGREHFILELPRYRLPQWRNVVLTMIQKVKIFAFEAGKVIFFISILLWLLSAFGPPQKIVSVHQKYEQLEQEQGELTSLDQQHYNADLLLNSYAGHIGKAIEPAIKPLGYDWKIGISLLTSFAAREVFVGTMATIYSVESGDGEPESLRNRMLAEKNPKTGLPVYTPATVFSLLIFFAFAMQCMSTLAVVKRETKSWKWPMIQLAYLTILAYGLSFIAYNVLR